MSNWHIFTHSLARYHSLLHCPPPLTSLFVFILFQIVGEYEEIEEEGERPSSPSIQGVDNNIDNDESQA